MTPRRLAIVVVLAAFAGACSGGGPSQAPASHAPGSLVLVAMTERFDLKELHAPAGAAFQLTLDNQDSEPHNVGIYTDTTYTKNVFPGMPIDPAHHVQVYDVGALTPGTYAFRCEIHPTNMTGTLIVGS
jgi:plastocyanin